MIFNYIHDKFKLLKNFYFLEKKSEKKFFKYGRPNLVTLKFITAFLEKKKYAFFKKKSIQKEQEMLPRQKDVIVYRLIFKVTKNNVFITVIDPIFGHVFYSSGGLKYFYLRKNSVTVANLLLGENLGLELRSKLINFLDIEFVGLPRKSHRLNFVKGLIASKLHIRSIIDKTPIAHNGCFRKKKRRKKFRNR